MDGFRSILDELMGKDRDLPRKDKLRLQKHFDSPEVCKFYLLDFCPHDLFPNTRSDLGPCKKRHDQYFKQQFNKDSNREGYQIKYEEMLMDFLEELIAEVDNKMKKSLERIEAPLPETEKPKDIVDQIRTIDNKIQELIEAAEKFGEVGRIDDSEMVMRQIDRLKDQKNELNSFSEHPLMMKEKQMKVCDVCGAMQSMQDNEKRLQTHVEGKLHTGYAKIREYLEMLRRRKLERKLRLEEEKEKERMQRELREKEKIREKESQRDYHRSDRSDHRDYRGDKGDYRDKKRRKSNSRENKYDRGERRDFRKTETFNREERDRGYKSREEKRRKSRSRSRSKDRKDRHKKRRHSNSKSTSR
jgi:hypothetical protein